MITLKYFNLILTINKMSDTNTTLEHTQKNITQKTKFKKQIVETEELHKSKSSQKESDGLEKSKFLQPESIRLQDYELMVETMNSELFKGLFGKSNIFGGLKISSNKSEDKDKL